MTVNKLIRELQKAEKKYGKRAHVVVSRKTVDDVLPDYSHCNVEKVEVESILWAREDCFLKADGTERNKTVVTLGCK